ncbi:MAG TPA: AMP-binding protein [Candidatus Acidoferrales bacterium]|nr:AMP-binding protein [Candidatus Acidoferrales bacterium]
MTFLDAIFANLESRANRIVVREIRDGQFVSATGHEMLSLVARARQFISGLGLKKGDRCALLAPNSIRWIALDLALVSEGIIVVPLYTRQSAAELSPMIQDADPRVLIASDAALAGEIRKILPVDIPFVPMDQVFAHSGDALLPSSTLADSDPVTIVYTSGTSGQAKGVVLNVGNVTHILKCTNQRLDLLMTGHTGPENVFHYTPLCFAASWIATLTFLSRNCIVTLSMDLAKLSDELKLASPHYFLNVPTLLERVRAKITESIQQRGGIFASIFSGAQRAFYRKKGESAQGTDSLYLWIARKIMFPRIRQNIGPNLKALICGSAPLAPETQMFFMMIGITVLQVYGLTETTAICTMDDPRDFEPGSVGKAIPGIEMKISENGEIVVRGPNIFPGYWRRPEETAKALEGGWFHTGDQGEVDEKGRWRVTGRLKNLVVLNSGHKFAPEPLEQAIALKLPAAQQVVVTGNQRSYPAVLIAASSANGLQADKIQSVLSEMNAALPHYKHIRAFHVIHEPFSTDNGLLTANGKIKRDAVCTRFAADIERLYQRPSA